MMVLSLVGGMRHIMIKAGRISSICMFSFFFFSPQDKTLTDVWPRLMLDIFIVAALSADLN